MRKREAETGISKEKEAAIEILLVEDSLEGVVLMKVLMRQSRFDIHWNAAKDGEEALALLNNPGNFSNKKMPDLILLDLNMPKMNGHEFLEEIKKDVGFNSIPVLIMTNSTDEKDRVGAYERDADFYIVKPRDIDHSAEMVKYIEDFWLKRIR
jgi:chemotaxis family two-component system response regulator Rcp1